MSPKNSQVKLIGVTYDPFWPFGREEHGIAIRESGTEPFEISEFERRQYDEIITREVDDD